MPAAPRSSQLAAAQRSRVAALAAPRESAASSFAITAHRLGRGGGATLTGAEATSSSADAVAQVMMDHAVVGSRGSGTRTKLLYCSWWTYSAIPYIFFGILFASILTRASHIEDARKTRHAEGH